jgi:hypothetical protein
MPDDIAHINEAENGAWETIDSVSFGGLYTRLEVDDFDSEEEEADHFNGGTIRIVRPGHGTYNHTVVETVVEDWSDEVVWISGNHTYYNGCQYRLVDDDNFDNASLSLEVTYPRTPDPSALNAALQAC